MNNSDLLGTLLPLLMSGSGIGDVLRALGGAGNGAATMDGLRSMMSQSLSNARRYYPILPDRNSLNKSFENVVYRLGGDPYSGAGQGAVSLIRSLYAISPDLVGGLTGIPNTGRMYRMLANGASGISMAGGFGMTDFANPYSVMESQRRAIALGRTVQRLSTNEDGGYNVNFTHGLNMEEVGKVSQRLLSSSIAYQKVAEGENGNLTSTGERIGAGAKGFDDNLKKLGEKFNEAVSMLSKVTGSVDEALNVMDRLGGGNFLGGTVEDASKIAQRAKRMAANIRVTAAMSGMSPTELYANMSGLQTSMSGGMGMSKYIAGASGFAGLMTNLAYNATMGYGAWAATHPNATQQEKDAAMLAVNGRTMAYASSNGAQLASLVADNRKLFTQEQLERIRRAYAEGRPNDVSDMIRDVVGSRLYTEHMTNQSMNIASRNRVSKNAESQQLMEELDSLGVSGNLDQANQVGASRMLNIYMRDLDDSLTKRAGDKDFKERRNNAVKSALAKKAVDAGILTEKEADSFSLDQLRTFMLNRDEFNGADIERIENSTRIAEARKQIQENTMSDQEQNSARARILAEAKRRGLRKEEQDKIKNTKGGGAALATLLSHITDPEERERVRHEMTRGKLFEDEAKREQMKFDEIEKNQKAEYTSDERIAAIKRDSATRNFSDSLGLKSKALGSANMSGFFKERYGEQEGNKKFEDLQKRAARGLVKDLLGEEFGDVKDKGELDKIIDDLANKDDKTLGTSGENVQDELVSRLERMKEGASKERKDAIDSAIKRVKSGEFDNKALNLRVVGYLDEEAKGDREKAVSWLEEQSGKEFNGTDVGEFFDNLEATGLYDKKTLDDLRKRASDAASKEGADTGGILKDSLAEIQQRGLRTDSYFAMTAVSSADKAGVLMASMEFLRGGGDIKDVKKMFGLSDADVDMLSKLDKDKANASMNAVSNFWGGGSFSDEAVKYTEKQIDRIRERLDLKEEDIENIAKGDKDTIERIRGELGGPDADRDIALIKSVATGDDDYSKAVRKAISFSGGEDRSDLDKLGKDKDYKENMLGVARKAGQNESQAYELMNSLSGFITNMSRIFHNPDQVFNVKIVDGAGF